MAEDLKPQLEELTKQTSRVAYALELIARGYSTVNHDHFNVCSSCGCTLVVRGSQRCPACNVEVKST